MLVFALLGCTEHRSVERVEPTFIYVSLAEGTETGTAEEPLEFTSEPVEIPIEVQLQNLDGDPYLDFDGDLTLNVRPGDLEGDPRISLQGATWSGTVSIKNGFGATRVWVSDLGDKDQDSGRAPSHATGVSPAVHYKLPTLAQMNNAGDHETNNLDKEFARIRSEDRDIRVTTVGAAGFWVTDMAEDQDPETGVRPYAHLFVYTFSKPDDEVVEGAKVTFLQGNNQEYLATSQLSFPSYEIDETAGTLIPDPVTIDFDALCDDNEALEAYESAIVRLEDVKIPSTFTAGTEDYEDYLEYGQYPLSNGGDCTFYAESSVTVPTFYPTEHVGEDVAYIQGTLSEIWGKWILNVRDAEDLPEDLRPSETEQAARSGSAPIRPVPRPRP